MKDKTTANLTNFKPSGDLGELFEKAKLDKNWRKVAEQNIHEIKNPK